MNWKILDSPNQLNEIDTLSKEKTIAIFKHSTRCSISAMAKSRLERSWNIDKEDLEIYYLDLIQHRNISNEIESRYQVRHESPQVLLVKNGKVSHHSSHLAISVEDIKSSI